MKLFKDFLIGVCFATIGFVLTFKLIKKNNKKEINFYYSILIFLFYLFGVLVSSFKEYGNNLQMVTPLSNVSPLLFTLTLISIFLPENWRNRVYKFMCNFNIVMIVAGFISIIYSLVVCPFYFKFLIFDEFAHITYCLFTIYLLKSGQVTISKKDFGFNCLTMALILGLVFGLNLIFNWNLFGLCLNDGYGIYGNKIFGNCHLSNLVYVCALALVMVLSYYLSKLFKNKH